MQDQKEKEILSALTRLWRDADFSRLNVTEKKSRLNVFRILKTEHHEIRHSNFLEFLFDPTKEHSFHDRFFADFCELHRIRRKSGGGLRVSREENHTDIMIRDEANSLLVVVENKFHSSEHGDQLRRYRRLIESAPEYDRFNRKKFVYLTLKGEEPAGDRAGWLKMKYENVGVLIENMLKGKNLEPELRLVLRNYVEIIRQ